MRFRPGTPDDIPRLIPFVSALYRLHAGWDEVKYRPRPAFETGYARWLTARATDTDSVLLVATVDDADDAPPVAFLVAEVLDEIPVFLLNRYGFIHDLWVEEMYRNEGVARQLVTLALERFKAMGVTQVRAEVATANGPAAGLLGACGFRAASTTMLAEI
jgi:ribosomal protein S18 acetylase RimI-like enzyme